MGGNLSLGARNLLQNCADLRAGDHLLVLSEDPETGFYDPSLGEVIVRAAQAMGARATVHAVPFAPVLRDLPDDLGPALAAADRVLFLARMGDQLRFSPALADLHPVVSYALDADMLGSDFGCAHHHAFQALRDCLNNALSVARHIHVTCPLGTDFEGPGANFPAYAGEVTVRRFPLSVFAPVPAAPYRGKIAQAGFLTGTGSTYYAPYSAVLGNVLEIHFDQGRITRFDGPDRDLALAHYTRVAQGLGIDRDNVHSWHAGIHPGCGYRDQAGADLARWSGGAFGNPRLLHFHTCGEYAPGEISLNVVDPTVRLDGIAVWDNGRLHPERVPGGAEILARYPCAAKVFANPSQDIGLTPTGRLSASVE
ncbi:MAG: hypothetical protein Q7J57_02025 [Gemmobacter sp.]|nr:hypothetical protein [Gemmobacter sp.]